MNGYSSSANRGMSGAGGAFLGLIGGMVLWALFGDKIKQKVNESRAYQEMKTQVMDRVSSIKGMTEQQYHKIVDDVSATYATAKGISQNELKDLVSDLKFHWTRIKDRWNEPPSINNNTGMTSAGSDPKIDDGFNFRT